MHSDWAVHFLFNLDPTVPKLPPSAIYCSAVSRNAIEVISVAAIIVVYSAVSSVQMLPRALEGMKTVRKEL